jgi:hypothetical protein
MPTEKKMLLVTDAAGQILAVAHKYDGQPSKMNVGLAPLPGQEIHEVDIPEHLVRLKSGHDFHLALSQARFHRSTGKIAFPKITYKKDH